MNDSLLTSSTTHDSADSSRKALEDLGELRPDLIHNPKYVRKTLRVYAPLIGALGVLSGYTLYFKIEPIVGGEPVSTLFLELLIAAGMVAVLEWVKNIIPLEIKHPAPSRHSVISSIFTVVLFELFVLAAHSLVDVNWEPIPQPIRDIWQGSLIDFVMFGLVWMMSGAVLTHQISKAIFARSTTTKYRVWYGAWRGVAAGLVAAGVVLVSLAALRVIWAVKMVVTDHAGWVNLLDQTPIASVPARALDYRLHSVHPFGHSVPFGWVILLVAAILLAYWSWKTKNWKPFDLLVVATSVILVLPVADGNGWKLVGEVFLAWSLPGAILGATASWLTSEMTLPKWIGAVPLLAALALAVFYHGPSELILILIPITILIVTGIELLSRRRPREFWPLAALSIAIVICLITTPILRGLDKVSGLLGDLNRLAPQGSFSKVILGDTLGPTNHFMNSKHVVSKDEAADAVLWQLCITGSLSFWVSVGLLISRSVRETQERTSLYSDGKNRCFWVERGSKEALEYHDFQHGVLPKSDCDLFTRLAVELLTGGTPWGYVSVYSKAFENLAPQTVARMSAEELSKYIREIKALKDHAKTSRSRVGAVVENARCLQVFYGQHGVENMLIRTLQIKAETGPEAAIRFFRSTFRVKNSFAVGSFLQATGFFPGAHFQGCWRYTNAP